MARRRLGAVLLALAVFVLGYFAGDYLLTASIDAMRREGLIIGDEASWRFYAGLLKTVPGYVGLALTFLWGVLADRLGRPRLILALGAAIGFSLAAVAASTSYYFLLAVLTVFGVAKTGVSPVIYAFIPDLVPPEKRGIGYAAYYTPSVLGFILGVVLAGVLLYWRTAYLAAAAIVLAGLAPLYLMARGVGIGEAESRGEGTAEVYRLREALRQLRKPTVLVMTLQIVPWTIPWGFITLFAVDYLMTRWGISRAAASLVLAVAAFSIALGHVAGGLLGDRRVRRGDLLGRFRVSALGILIGYLAMVAMLAYPYPYGVETPRALLGPTLLAAAGLMFSTLAYPNLSSVISDCVEPRHRGTVFALYNILNTAGWATGPALYGLLVKQLAASMPERQALLYAAVGLTSLWLLSLAAWLLAARYYPRDRVTGLEA